MGIQVSGTVTLTNNTFTGNTASSSYGCGGGGAYVSGTVTLTNNTFTENTATDRKYSTFGGGVCVHVGNGTATLTNNTFTDNTANGLGGGAYVGGTVTLTDNTFTGNISSDGGGSYITGTSTLTNNTFTGNTASTNGGGLSFYSNGNATLTNNTLSSNTSDGGGGGVYLTITNNDYSGYLYNNIIWNNTAATGDDLYIDNTGSEPFFPVTANLFNNDFDQSASGTYMTVPFTIDPSNLDNADPLFVGGGDYRLTASSPCINTGDNDAPGLPSTDKDGNPRIVGGTVDMGAYEFGAAVYVSSDGLCGGKTPCYPTIQAGVDAATTGAAIRVAEGTYSENLTFDSSNTLTLQGGWDLTFTTQSSTSTIKSMTITDGTVEVENIVLQ